VSMEASTGLGGLADFAAELIQVLTSQGHEAYIVGGFCRELLLGVVSEDLDIATSALPEQVLGLILPGASLRRISAAEAYPVVQVGKGDLVLEVATFRRDVYREEDSRRPGRMELTASLVEDAGRRDLTVNALYYDPLTQEMIDPLDTGFQDLQAGCIRFIGDPVGRIREDRIRILRAVRLRNVLGFAYAPETRQALVAASLEVLRIQAKERIRSELLGMLLGPVRTQALEDLDALGIWEALVPEAEGALLAGLPEQIPEHLLWAALFWDGFSGTQAGAVRPVLDRLRVPKDCAEATVWLLKQADALQGAAALSLSQKIRLVRPDLAGGQKIPGLFAGLRVLLEAREAWPASAERIHLEVDAFLASHCLGIKEEFGLDGEALAGELGIGQQDPQRRHLGELIEYLNLAHQDDPGLSKERILEMAALRWRTHGK
jgi:tRNA nucleotidyltransferase/poly(A) polymerase